MAEAPTPSLHTHDPSREPGNALARACLASFAFFLRSPLCFRSGKGKRSPESSERGVRTPDASRIPICAEPRQTPRLIHRLTAEESGLEIPNGETDAGVTSNRSTDSWNALGKCKTPRTSFRVHIFYSRQDLLDYYSSEERLADTKVYDTIEDNYARSSVCPRESFTKASVASARLIAI